MLNQQSEPDRNLEAKATSLGQTQPAPRGALDVSLLKKVLGEDFDEKDERVKLFTQRLCQGLTPDTTKEAVVEKVVSMAVEVEFGAEGIKILGLERFIKLMSEAILLNEEMLERTIALASRCLQVKLNISGQPVQ